MRLLKRQPGLPFLMALGVLLILSASFLAVQLWSEKVYRGAAEALEAPVMPPAMPTARKGKSGASLDKKIEKAKTVAAVEVVSAPEVQNTEEAVAPEPAVAPGKAKPAALKPAKLPEMIEAPAMPAAAGTREKPVRNAKATKAVEPVIEPSEPAVSVAPVVAEPLSKVMEPKVAEPTVVKADTAPAITAVETVVKPVKAVEEPRKTSVKKKRAARGEDESEIPQEWNWFNAPLKIEVSEGRVEIVSAEALPGLDRLAATTSRSESVVVEPSADKQEELRQVEPSLEKPFVAALARMGKLRSMRSSAIVKNPGLEKAVLARRSESLERLHEAVTALCGKLDKVETPRVDSDPIDGHRSVSAAVEDVPVAADTEKSSPESICAVETEKSHQEEAVGVDDHKFVPYYSGSGSDLSNRINDLVIKGVGSRRR